MLHARHTGLPESDLRRHLTTGRRRRSWEQSGIGRVLPGAANSGGGHGGRGGRPAPWQVPPNVYIILRGSPPPLPSDPLDLGQVSMARCLSRHNLAEQSPLGSAWLGRRSFHLNGEKTTLDSRDVHPSMTLLDYLRRFPFPFPPTHRPAAAAQTARYKRHAVSTCAGGPPLREGPGAAPEPLAPRSPATRAAAAPAR